MSPHEGLSSYQPQTWWAPTTRPLRRFVAALASLTTLAVTGVVAITVTPAYAAVPAAPVPLPTSVEPMSPYQPQAFCDPVDKPGVVAFGKLLTATYPGTTIVDISRGCDSESGTSEHKDGRALDWGVNVADPTQKAQAQALLTWLFATDAGGNKDAMARRLGIMYIIWNARIWGAWSQRWEPYSCSGVTACHKDHMHFSFDWSGAKKRTSFWTGVATAPMPPPTYVYKSLSFAQSLTVDAARPLMTTPFEVLAGATYRFTVSGTYRYDATTGHRADAECSTTNGAVWTATAPGDVSPSTGLLDLSVAGRRWWRPAVGTGGGCNTATHTYTRTITFATTAPVSLVVNDLTRGDDKGSLSLTVARVA
jgi:hypothetical protein